MTFICTVIVGYLVFSAVERHFENQRQILENQKALAILTQEEEED